MFSAACIYSPMLYSAEFKLSTTGKAFYYTSIFQRDAWLNNFMEHYISDTSGIKQMGFYNNQTYFSRFCICSQLNFDFRAIRLHDICLM